MTTRLIFGLLIIGLINFSCHKDNSPLDFPYEAIVMGPNSDCGIYQIMITQGLDKAKSIVGSSVDDNIYIAQNLPNELKTNGITIKLDLRKPENSELGVCTSMGPSYTWIFVMKATEK
jgi:hypothetical protein